MSTRRTSIVLLTLVAGFAGNRPADAGCCCDWLFGRKEPAYVVGYAPYAVGYAAPAAAQPVVVQRMAVPVSQPTQLLSSGGPENEAAINGAYQLQRPAFDNPSVYTGMPVIMAPGPTQTSFQMPMSPTVMPQAPTVSAYRPIVQAYQQPNVVPLTSRFRGQAAATSNPIYGTGNIYPNNYQVTRYQAAYPEAVATTSAVAPTDVCPTPVVQAAPVPVVVAAPPKRCCGLSCFFGSCWGKTNYQTSYYRAPITYYRPVTSVDPVMGTTVTVQQPCTSTVQQIQRTPYNSLFSQSTPTMAPVAGANCGAGCGMTSPPSTYLQPSVSTPSMGAPVYGGQTYGGVGQVGGITSPSDQSVMPIPSTDPSYLQQPSYTPNTQPLQGGGSTGGDMQQVPQPRLESARPTIEAQPQPQVNNDSFWGSSDYQEKTARNSLQPSDRSNSTTQNYSQLRPIEAPNDYASPIAQRSSQSPAGDFPSTAPVTRRDLSAPPLLPPAAAAEFNPRGTNSASVRVSVPVREATMTRSRAVTPTRVRDTGGWQAND